ncbi:MAG: hypothetical protein UX07_C0026G0013, partial [Parcubacteria group bacterium GW2011_GWA2_45_30]
MIGTKAYFVFLSKFLPAAVYLAINQIGGK